MEQWSSRFGFVLASIGAAVGLGNVWRFSAVVGTNGGGAYLVPYAIAFFVFALPLVVLEIAAGREFRADVVTTFTAVDRRLQAVGWVVVIVVVVVVSYYLVITGWTLSFLAVWAVGADATFTSYTGSVWPVVSFLVATGVTAGVLSLGVKAGIERLSTVLVPLVFVILVGMALYGATLSGFGTAVAYLFEPDFSVLGDPLLWGAAFGQAFFSLSAGQGILLTYGSYLDEKASVAKSAGTVAVADFLVAILAGLVIFPIVFTFGLEPTLGTELAFTTLPRAFAEMPGGRLVAVAFFGLLFFAAITSAVSMLEVAIAATMRTMRLGRGRATAAVTTVVVALGLPSALSYSSVGFGLAGLPFLDLLDETVGTLGLPVTALCIAVAFAWVAPEERMREAVGVDAAYLVPKLLLPVVLLVVIGLRIGLGFDPAAWHLVPTPEAVGANPLLAFAWFGVFALVGVGLVRLRQRRRRRRRQSQSTR
jgi:NSS family neurotransmitter:Na+ symporter